jgi:hypothetical protein
MDTGNDSNAKLGGWSRSKLALIGFLAIAAYFLWTEHRAHVIQFLPYGLLLLCPLLHFFHGGNHEDPSGGARK